VRVGRYAGGTRRAETTTQQVECEQEHDEEESSAATAHDDRHAQSATAGRSARAARLATLVLNLARIELRVLVESHEAARESASVEPPRLTYQAKLRQTQLSSSVVSPGRSVL